MSPGDPKPKGKNQITHAPLPWRVAREVRFSESGSQRDVGFDEVLLERRSRRKIKAAATSVVASVIREIFATRLEGKGNATGRKRKVILSAGALHPIRCVFFRSGEDVMLFDDENARFLKLVPTDQEAINRFVQECRDVLPEADGHWILLIADAALVSGVYENAPSLAWRDAGAALQGLAMVSEAAGLAFCPLGLLGQQAAEALLDPSTAVLGVGVAAIGRRDAD